jgi:PST family polysaccharide transporter
MNKILLLVTSLLSLSDRPYLLSVLKNSGWLMFDSILRGVSALAIGTWIARYLGPEQFGELSYILAYLMFFQVVANMGMDGIVVKEIVKLGVINSHSGKSDSNSDISEIKENADSFKDYQLEIGEILGATFVIRIIVGLFCWLLAIGGMILIYGLSSQNVLLTALAGSCLIFQAANTIDLWFQSQNQSRRTVLVKLLAFVISNGFRIAFIIGQLPIVSFAVAMFIEFAITAAALCYAYKKMTCGSKWFLSIKTVGLSLIKQSWPFMISGLSVAMYMRIDQVMIRHMLGQRELGIYSAAIILSSMWYVLPSIACTSLLPTLTLTKLIDDKLYTKRIVQMFRVFLLTSIVISGIVVWKSDVLIQIFYGEKYLDASNILKILIITTIPVFVGVGQSAWLINEGKSKLYLIQTLAGGVLSIFLNLILIPKYGLLGAASSVLLAQLTAAFTINFLLEKKLFFMQLGVLPKCFKVKY